MKTAESVSSLPIYKLIPDYVLPMGHGHLQIMLVFLGCIDIILRKYVKEVRG
jgi:hypothetical protein